MANVKKNTETEESFQMKGNLTASSSKFSCCFFFFFTHLTESLYEKQTNEILYRILWNMKNFSIYCRLKGYLNVKFSKHDKYEKWKC